LHAGSLRVYVAPTGAFRDLDAVRDLRLRLPTGASVALRDLGTVERGLESPLQTAAFNNGQRAVVFAVAMERGRDVKAFGEVLREGVASFEPLMPLGYRLEWVTFQADVVEDAIGDVTTTLYQTVAVVVLSTVVVLGWRTGLLVGALVPLTMLGTLLAMRPLGLELHNVSIAAFIIALGILVDNGTVVAEDILRRASAGEGLRAAAERAGQSLAAPLLIATGVAVLAFSPPFFSQSYAAEFLRGLSLVIAITLILSWLLAVMGIPLGAFHLLGRDLKLAKADGAGSGTEEDQRYHQGVYLVYRRSSV
jgi:multidrug efflux pump